MGGICRFAEQSAVFEIYEWTLCDNTYGLLRFALAILQAFGFRSFASRNRYILMLGGASLHFVIIPTDCFASLSQSYNHSDSAASLRETATSSCLAIIKKVAAVSCKHGRLPPFSNLVLSHHSAHACACWCCRGFFFNVCYYRLCCQ